METTEQAAWDERYSGPDLVWGAEQVMRPVWTPEGERTAIDTLVRAERPA